MSFKVRQTYKLNIGCIILAMSIVTFTIRKMKAVRIVVVRIFEDT